MITEDNVCSQTPNSISLHRRHKMGIISSNILLKLLPPDCERIKERTNGDSRSNLMEEHREHEAYVRTNDAVKTFCRNEREEQTGLGSCR